MFPEQIVQDLVQQHGLIRLAAVRQFTCSMASGAWQVTIMGTADDTRAGHCRCRWVITCRTGRAELQGSKKGDRDQLIRWGYHSEVLEELAGVLFQTRFDRAACQCQIARHSWAVVATISRMGRTTKHQQALYLEHEKAALLDELAVRTRIPKAVLLREAVDDLLVKYQTLRDSERAVRILLEAPDPRHQRSSVPKRAGHRGR